MRKSLVSISIGVGLMILLVFLPKGFPSAQETIFAVEKGEGSKDIARNLEKEGFVWWGQLFRVYVLTRGISNDLKAGLYKVSPSMSIFSIAEKMAAGDVAKETVTIPEGFTAEEILQKLESLRLVGPDHANLALLQEREGMLFPDTYQIPFSMTLPQIIEMMNDNFWKKNQGLDTTRQVVIMASLLEKELKTKEDREIASGILWKRIRVGIPLQVDVDMWTYKNTGLPPKAVGNPGLESILAALNPKTSAYWYYLSTPDGKTIFSRTLEEHNIAKAKYLK